MSHNSDWRKVTLLLKRTFYLHNITHKQQCQSYSIIIMWKLNIWEGPSELSAFCQNSTKTAQSQSFFFSNWTYSAKLTRTSTSPTDNSNCPHYLRANWNRGSHESYSQHSQFNSHLNQKTQKIAKLMRIDTVKIQYDGDVGWWLMKYLNVRFG